VRFFTPSYLRELGIEFWKDISPKEELSVKLFPLDEYEKACSFAHKIITHPSPKLKATSLGKSMSSCGVITDHHTDSSISYFDVIGYIGNNRDKTGLKVMFTM
jgi:hypothetical protein